MFQKKRFGQHFLINHTVLANIANYAGLSIGDRCIEIGPGKGALTDYLLKTKANLHAIELDKRLEKQLAFTQRQHPNFSYTLQDVLTVDWETLLIEKTTIVGNLPYEISTPLLFQLLPHRAKINRMVFLLQREVVERMAASVGTRAYGRLSVMMQYYFSVSAMDIVEPGDFDPPPKVMSQIVMLTPREESSIAFSAFEAFVKRLFSNKRKMIRRQFKESILDTDWQQLGIDPKSRAEGLTMEEILRLFHCWQEKQ